ncbi:MAG: DUF5684 domain-containing protein [Paludibacteraceae bacterium]|nr:DUF5684 domain-containing protein [Paludibacteraceae bacterium]
MEKSMLFATLFGLIFGLAIGVFLLIAEWKVYTKAGKPGWAVIVPIYNILMLLEIIGKPWWWLLLMLIPGVNIVFLIWAMNLLSKSFGKDEGFTVGLLFLSIIFLPILGFGDAKYVGPAGEAKTA